MAKRYTGEILRFQPTGPYRLCGYSFGGVAATEIAHQLTARGHEVELVALFDSHLPHKEPLALRFQRHLTSLSGLSMQAKADYLWEKITGNVRTHLETSKRNAEKAQKLAISREHVQKGLPVPIELQGPYFYAHCRRIWEEYRPARYPGRLVLFRQTERSWFYRDVPDLGWGSASDHLEIVDIPGGHGALLQEPQVKDVADRLRTLLKSKS
jgi:thioesterase domain-containing protein